MSYFLHRRIYWGILSLGLLMNLALVLAGCGNKDPEASSAAQDTQTQAKHEDHSPQPPEFAVEPQDVTLPAGTVVRCLLQENIGTELQQPGDFVVLQAAERIVFDGQMVVSVGSTLRAKVLHARAATSRQQASMALQVVSLETPSGREVDCVTQPVRLAARDLAAASAATARPSLRAAWHSHASIAQNNLHLKRGATLDIVIVSPVRLDLPWGSI